MLDSLAHSVRYHECWTLGGRDSSADLTLDAESPGEAALHMPALVASETIDVFHSALPRMPSCLPCKSIVTIHDAIPIARPDLTSPAFARLFADAHDDIRGADCIICPSASAKADIVRLLGIPAGRIAVIPECPAAHFRPSTGEETEALRRRLGLEGTFFLVVGSIERRKNPGLVLEALSLLPEASAVFVGPAAGFDVAAEAKRRGVESRVRVLGHIADADLVPLYGAAEALLFPSFYEGFGLPLVEAFACETPVLCSRAASLPEVAGDAAIFFDPLDAKSVVAAIEELRGTAARRADLVACGRERLRCYSPEAVLRELAALYDRLEASDPTRARDLVMSGGRA